MDKNEDIINHPKHYTSYPIEVIDMMIKIWGEEKTMNYCIMNAFKYRMRIGLKNKKPDNIDTKDKWYLNGQSVTLSNNIDEDLGKEKWYLNKADELKRNLKKLK